MAVGDKDGLPHLMTYGPNDHADALARLRKNAGEGKFHYTQISEYDDDDLDDDDDTDEGNLADDDEPHVLLSEIELGALNPCMVRDVVSEDLINTDLLKVRAEPEQLICMAEAFIRTVELEHSLTGDEEALMEREWKYYQHNDIHYSESETGAYQRCIDIMTNYPAVEWTRKDEHARPHISSMDEGISKIKDNPVLAALLNIVELVGDPKDEKMTLWLTSEMSKLSQHDIIQMSFALREAVTNDSGGNFSKILEQPGYDNVFSGKTENFHEDCLTLFYMIQVIRYSRSNNIALAIEYYFLLSGQHENLLCVCG